MQIMQSRSRANESMSRRRISGYSTTHVPMLSHGDVPFLDGGRRPSHFLSVDGGALKAFMIFPHGTEERMLGAASCDESIGRAAG